jgi:hypothetical protein
LTLKEAAALKEGLDFVSHRVIKTSEACQTLMYYIMTSSPTDPFLNFKMQQKNPFLDLRTYRPMSGSVVSAEERAEKKKFDNTIHCLLTGTDSAPFWHNIFGLYYDTAELKRLQAEWKPRVRKKFIQSVKEILSTVKYLENLEREVTT